MESDIPQRDDELVQKCLSGSEEAWGTLIDKYKNLIFSIPVKYGFRTDEADEIFQDVCLALLIGLPQLRKRQALAAWLIQTTSHRCFHWKRQRQRHVATEFDELFSSRETEKMPENILREAEREQMLREALSELRPRCHDLIRMRFFQEPPVRLHRSAFLIFKLWTRPGMGSRARGIDHQHVSFRYLRGGLRNFLQRSICFRRRRTSPGHSPQLRRIAGRASGIECPKVKTGTR